MKNIIDQLPEDFAVTIFNEFREDINDEFYAKVAAIRCVKIMLSVADEYMKTYYRVALQILSQL